MSRRTIPQSHRRRSHNSSSVAIADASDDLWQAIDPAGDSAARPLVSSSDVEPVLSSTQVESLTPILIASSEHMGALRKRLGSSTHVAVFSDSESLRALEAILARPPKFVILDSKFAATARGATLVARIKAEPRLRDIEIRVLIGDEDKVPLFLSQAAASTEQTLVQASRPLNRVGTRSAVRFPMNRRVVVVNGQRNHLIDLSVTGAQVLVGTTLRPNHRVRLILSDELAGVRCQGTVVWSVAVPTGPKIHYRAGVEFSNPDSTELGAFCVKFGGEPDRTFGAP